MDARLNVKQGSKTNSMSSKNNYTSCNNCNTTNTRLLLKISSKEFINNCVQCKKCGLIYTNPQPSETFLNNMYSDNYFNSGHNNLGYSSYKNEEKSRMNKFKKYLNIIEGFSDNNKQALDIGAGFGYFLAEAQKRGWGVNGVELSKYARREAKKRFSINLVEKLKELPCQKKYNLVTMFDVIEHVKGPVNMLRALSKLIDNNGLLVVRVPVVDSKEGVRKGNSFFKMDHLYNFSKDIIIGMIKKRGVIFWT